MPEEKKGILSSFSVGNIITIAIIIFGAVTTWVGINNHMNDDTLHINPGEKVLTEQQFNQLILWSDEFPNIQVNESSINDIRIEIAVFLNDYSYTKSELDGLEGKVSRNYIELRNKIEE